MRLLVTLLCIALLALGIVLDAWPWIVDDAFISLRFAERLLDGRGLTWTDGEAVEGYSNLAWILASAALGWLGLDLVTAVRVLGCVCTVATFVVLLHGSMLPSSLASRMCVAITAALATTSLWAIGGLEAPLLMLALAVAMTAIDAATRAPAGRWRSRLLLAGTALAVACWTRPDAPLWVAIAATLLFVRRPLAAAGRLRPVLWLLALPAAAVLAQFAFRLAYYGDYVPNTAHAKLGSSASARSSGVAYVTAAAVAMRALLLPCLLGVVAVLVRRTRFVPAFALVGSAIWWCYILSVGGDAFPRSRLLLPTLAPLTVLAAHGIDLIAARGRRAATVAIAAVALLIGLARFDASRADAAAGQQLSDWEWVGIGAGEWLGRAFAAQQPLLAVDAAGAVPFASRLPSLDMLGLCDRTIAATEPPADAGFVPGHHRGNGAYVLSRRPDLVMFGVPPGSPQPQWLGGRQLEAMQQFRDDYRVLLFTTGPWLLGDGRRQDLRLTLWGRLDGRAGVQRDGGVVRVPGYWLGSLRQPCSLLTPAEPADAENANLRATTLAVGAEWWLAARAVGVLHDGVTCGELRAHGRHVLQELPLATGAWQLELDPPTAGARLSLQSSASGTARSERDAFFVAGDAAADTAHIDLVLELDESVTLPLHVRGVTLRRRDQK